MTKLAELLTARKLLQQQRLAAKTGITLTRLQALASGEEPTIAELRLLSDALRVSLHELIAKPTKTQDEAELLFRKSAGALSSSVTTGGLARTISSTIELIRERRRISAPEWRNSFSPPEANLKSAEHNATVFRTLFCDDDQLSPLISLPQRAAEQMGVFIFVIKNSEIDGASAYVEGLPYAFVSERFKGRMLFTLAHELGHLIAHHGNDEAFAKVDANVEEFPNADSAQDEFYANAFASALLMPRVAVGLALRSIRRLARISSDEIGDIEIGYLARIFGLSFWAAARRCEDLELLPRGSAYALNQELIKRHGSAEKRGDEVGLPPRPEIVFPAIPRTLLEATVSAIRSGEVSVGKAATMLGLSVSDLFSANKPTAH